MGDGFPRVEDSSPRGGREVAPVHRLTRCRLLVSRRQWPWVLRSPAVCLSRVGCGRAAASPGPGAARPARVWDALVRSVGEPCPSYPSSPPRKATPHGLHRGPFLGSRLSHVSWEQGQAHPPRRSSETGDTPAQGTRNPSRASPRNQTTRGGRAGSWPGTRGWPGTERVRAWPLPLSVPASRSFFSDNLFFFPKTSLS